VAANYITVSLDERLGGRIRDIVDMLASRRSMLRDLKAALETMVDGSDYSMIEAELGLPAGKGQTVYNLVSGALSELDADTSFNQLLSWLGAVL
jgi:hypothetical protein